jgi:hypothetical protein
MKKGTIGYRLMDLPKSILRSGTLIPIEHIGELSVLDEGWCAKRVAFAK